LEIGVCAEAFDASNTEEPANTIAQAVQERRVAIFAIDRRGIFFFLRAPDAKGRAMVRGAAWRQRQTALQLAISASVITGLIWHDISRASCARWTSALRSCSAF
jgi:hypothetical protein